MATVPTFASPCSEFRTDNPGQIEPPAILILAQTAPNTIGNDLGTSLRPVDPFPLIGFRILFQIIWKIFWPKDSFDCDLPSQDQVFVFFHSSSNQSRCNFLSNRYVFGFYALPVDECLLIGAILLFTLRGGIFKKSPTHWTDLVMYVKALLELAWFEKKSR